MNMGAHDPVMTIVGEPYLLCGTQVRLLISSSEEMKDVYAAEKRRSRKVAAERRAKQITIITYLGLFIHAGSWMALPFRTAGSFGNRTALILRDQFPPRIHPSQCNSKLPEKDM